MKPRRFSEFYKRQCLSRPTRCSVASCSWRRSFSKFLTGNQSTVTAQGWTVAMKGWSVDKVVSPVAAAAGPAGSASLFFVTRRLHQPPLLMPLTKSYFSCLTQHTPHTPTVYATQHLNVSPVTHTRTSQLIHHNTVHAYCWAWLCKCFPYLTVLVDRVTFIYSPFTAYK